MARIHNIVIFLSPNSFWPYFPSIRTDRRNSNKSHDLDANDHNDNQQQAHFRQMQRRRLSAPDIRRHAPPIDKEHIQSDQQTTMFEQIVSPKFITQTNNAIHLHEQYKSDSKSLDVLLYRERKNKKFLRTFVKTKTCI